MTYQLWRPQRIPQAVSAAVAGKFVVLERREPYQYLVFILAVRKAATRGPSGRQGPNQPLEGLLPCPENCRVKQGEAFLKMRV